MSIRNKLLIISGTRMPYYFRFEAAELLSEIVISVVI